MTRSNAKVLHSYMGGDGRIRVVIEHDAQGRFGSCQTITIEDSHARFTDGQRVFVNGDRIEGEG